MIEILIPPEFATKPPVCAACGGPGPLVWIGSDAGCGENSAEVCLACLKIAVQILEAHR